MLCTIDKIQGYIHFEKTNGFFLFLNREQIPKKLSLLSRFNSDRKIWERAARYLVDVIDSKCGKAFDVLEIVLFIIGP